jgi:hypothetical protein
MLAKGSEHSDDDWCDMAIYVYETWRGAVLDAERYRDDEEDEIEWTGDPGWGLLHARTRNYRLHLRRIGFGPKNPPPEGVDLTDRENPFNSPDREAREQRVMDMVRGQQNKKKYRKPAGHRLFVLRVLG